MVLFSRVSCRKFDSFITYFFRKWRFLVIKLENKCFIKGLHHQCQFINILDLEPKPNCNSFDGLHFPAPSPPPPVESYRKIVFTKSSPSSINDLLLQSLIIQDDTGESLTRFEHRPLESQSPHSLSLNKGTNGNRWQQKHTYKPLPTRERTRLYYFCSDYDRNANIPPPPPSSSIIFSQIFSSVDFSLRATHRNLGSIRDLGRPLTEIVRNPKPQLRTAEFPNPCLPHSQTCLHFAMGLTD